MASKQRLDQTMTLRGMVLSRSQAENYIRLGAVYVNKKQVTKAGYFVADADDIELRQIEQYVSRAGLKLASVARILHLDFTDKIVLDVGSSTGGFTDYALQHGAKKVFAVDVGTNQLHPSLRSNKKISLHEQTDIRDFYTTEHIDYVVIDVSFISLRDVLPHIAEIIMKNTVIAAMCKPQFEAGTQYKHNGVIKNDAMRRKILQDFEQWAKQYFVIAQKADSDIKGAKGNQERFYKLVRLK
jgi:23S rRNA (cytidine1920-2'-O)/16S rRNA (cytidine1409-2'-O)-methyltransferase